MNAIIEGVLFQLSQISVSGLDVERMYLAKHQLRQLQVMLNETPAQNATPVKEAKENVENPDPARV